MQWVEFEYSRTPPNLTLIGPDKGFNTKTEEQETPYKNSQTSILVEKFTYKQTWRLNTNLIILKNRSHQASLYWLLQALRTRREPIDDLHCEEAGNSDHVKHRLSSATVEIQTWQPQHVPSGRFRDHVMCVYCDCDWVLSTKWWQELRCTLFLMW